MRVKLKEKQKNRAGFTLTELMIVVVIIGILSAIGVNVYRRVSTKAKAGKARHGITLIAEAEKIVRLDTGNYVAIAAGAVEATVGTAVTGINLAALDNDQDFKYSATGAGLVRARNSVVIGACAVNTTISLNLVNGVWVIPACYGQ